MTRGGSRRRTDSRHRGRPSSRHLERRCGRSGARKASRRCRPRPVLRGRVGGRCRGGAGEVHVGERAAVPVDAVLCRVSPERDREPAPVVIRARLLSAHRPHAGVTFRRAQRPFDLGATVATFSTGDRREPATRAYTGGRFRGYRSAWGVVWSIENAVALGCVGTVSGDPSREGKGAPRHLGVTSSR